MQQYRCNTHKECRDADTCIIGLPHEHKHVLDHMHMYCPYKGIYIGCNHHVTADPTMPITNLESALDTAIIEELERSTHPFADCAKRIRNRLLELIST